MSAEHSEFRGMESRVERLSFTPNGALLTLGRPEMFTLRGRPDHSVLRPQILTANSPCRGFVYVTRVAVDGHEHIGAPPRHLDSRDLRHAAEAVLTRGGFGTLSASAEIVIECEYTGLVPEGYGDEATYEFRTAVLGPGVLVVAL